MVQDMLGDAAVQGEAVSIVGMSARARHGMEDGGHGRVGVPGFEGASEVV